MQGRDEVVVLLAGLVVHEDALLEGFGGDGAGDMVRGLPSGAKAPESLLGLVFGTTEVVP